MIKSFLIKIIAGIRTGLFPISVPQILLNMPLKIYLEGRRKNGELNFKIFLTVEGFIKPSGEAVVGCWREIEIR